MKRFNKKEQRPLKSLKVVESLINKKHNPNILDVGASYGYLTNHLHKKGYNVKGIELEIERVKIGLDHYGNIPLFQGDYKKLDKREKYDYIVFVGLLEYDCQTPKQVIDILKQYLKPKGKIIISVSNSHSLKYRIKTLLGLEPIEPFIQSYWVFTRKRVEEMSKKLNFNLLYLGSFNTLKIRSRHFYTPDSLSEDILFVIEKKNNLNLQERLQ